MEVNDTTKSQQELYDYLWSEKGDYIPSKTSRPFAEYLSIIIPNKNARILEIGCGDGTTLQYLHERGYTNLTGMDISPVALKRAREKLPDEVELIQGAVDEFKGKHWEYTVSCDVLEHVPPFRVTPTLKTLLRITEKLSIHVIATFADSRRIDHAAVDVHPSLYPIQKWDILFRAVFCKTFTHKFLIFDRKDFLNGRNRIDLKDLKIMDMDDSIPGME